MLKIVFSPIHLIAICSCSYADGIRENAKRLRENPIKDTIQLNDSTTIILLPVDDIDTVELRDIE